MDSALTFTFLSLDKLYGPIRGLRHKRACCVVSGGWGLTNCCSMTPCYNTIDHSHTDSCFPGPATMQTRCCYSPPSIIGLLSQHTALTIKMAIQTKYKVKLKKPFWINFCINIKYRHVLSFSISHIHDYWHCSMSPAPLWSRALVIVVMAWVSTLHPLLHHLLWHLISLKTWGQSLNWLLIQNFPSKSIGKSPWLAWRILSWSIS